MSERMTVEQAEAEIRKIWRQAGIHVQKVPAYQRSTSLWEVCVDKYGDDSAIGFWVDMPTRTEALRMAVAAVKASK